MYAIRSYYEAIAGGDTINECPPGGQSTIEAHGPAYEARPKGTVAKSRELLRRWLRNNFV